ncbi:MAG: hypothetical protein H7Y17_03400 [Chlorobia bacterium]|nr:hypothetical protein [Fimbriimonadaceae bacterium]
MQTTLEIDTLTIHHQDGDLPYRLRNGGYSLTSDSISISIDCEATGEDDPFPPSALICLENCKIEHPPRAGDVLTCRGGMLVNDQDVPQRAWGYFTFHVDQITQTWTVESIEGDVIMATLEASHDDVNYYGDQARETTSRGRFALHRRSLNELWVPS